MNTRQFVVPLRVLSFATALCFCWSLVLASTLRAATDRPAVPPGHSRPLSAVEMSQITGAFVTPIGSDPGTGGGASGNAAMSPGAAFPWEGTAGGVKTGNGNKLTAIPLAGWTARGGLPVDLTLYHNSLSSFVSGDSRGSKWTLSYDSALAISPTTSNVKIGWGNGTVYMFQRNVDGSYTPPPGIHQTLVANGSSPPTSFDLTDKSQVKYHFSYYSSVNNYLLTTISNENGNAITVNRAAGGGILSITDPTNRTITIGANQGFVANATDAGGHEWYFNYDGNGNLVQVVYPVINGNAYSVRMGYDGNHNISSFTDKNNNVSTFGYNADSTTAWEKDPYGSQTSFAYYGSATPGSGDTTITDANGHVVTQNYTNGVLSSVADALNYSVYYTYDVAKNVTQKQDQRGYYWNYTYDGMGNVLTATPPGGTKSTLTYSAHNRVLTAQLPSGRSVAIAYDASDNPTQVQQKDASGNVIASTSITVGSYGLVSDKYDANGHHTSYTYDGNGNLATTTTPLGHKTQWSYDALGFQTQRIDAMGRTTNYTPDVWERLVTTTYPDSSTHSYTYDPNSNLLSWTDPTSGTWSRVCDADNRVLGEFANGTQVVAHHYDAAGQLGLLSTTNDYYGRTLTYSYTSRNALSIISEPAGPTSYAYDPNGNQISVYSDGHHTGQYYNPDNTLDSLYNYSSYGQGTAVFSSYGYAYNADHQMTGMNEGQSPNVHATANPTQTSYGYDALGHLTAEVRTGSTPYSYGYGYDPQGNRTSKTVGGAGATQYYDTDDEMTQINSPASLTFGYNANGDQVATTANAVVTNFGYDYDDQLVSLARPGFTSAYVYDALGRQVQRTSGGVATNYYYDGSVPLFESQNGVETGVYTWGNGLVRRNGEWALLDGVGSARQMTDGGQNVTSSSVSTAYGQALAVSGSTSCGYTFQGSAGYRTNSGDGPAGGSNYTKVGARYYDAEWGRFLTRDTDLSQSPYGYCDGDPVNCTDPSGHLSAVNIASGGVSVMGVSGGAADAPINTSNDNKINLASTLTAGGATIVADPSGGTVTATQGHITITGGNFGGQDGQAPNNGTPTIEGQLNIPVGRVTLSGGVTYGGGQFTLNHGLSYDLGKGFSVVNDANGPSLQYSLSL